MCKRSPLQYCVIAHEIAIATQHSSLFNEICTAAPPKQGKLLRYISPWKIYAREEKRGSGICGKNLLPHKLDFHGTHLAVSSMLRRIEQTHKDSF